MSSNIAKQPTQQEVDLATTDLVVGRIGMLMDHPWWGNVATRLILQPFEGDTAATDGRKLYFNPHFINKLKPKEKIFLIGHELLHIILDHMDRRNGREPTLWNIACDYAVNLELVEHKIGDRITTVPCLYDVKYKEMTAEEIYDDLLENAPEVTIDQLAKMVLDQHLEGEGEDGTDKLTEEEKQQIKDNIKEAMISAAQAVQPGDVPGSVRRLLKDITEPQMDWRQLVRQQTESQIRNDTTWMKPSRRGWGCDAVLPSMMKEPSVEAHVFFDVSGSIGDREVQLFMSELIGICEQHASFKIGVGNWDTRVQGYKEYDETSVDDIKDYEITGCGGTAPSCIYEFLKEKDIVPKMLIIFTDLEVGSDYGDADYCSNVLWVVKNSRKGLVAPHGQTVYFHD